MSFTSKVSAAMIAALMAGSAFAANTGGFATTDGGNVSGAVYVTATSMQEIIDAVALARIDPVTGAKVTSGAYPLVITYTGNEDALINQMIKDHTKDSAGNCPNPRWNDPYREVSLKEFTRGITIQGANGSSANFGITIVNGGNVVIRNMKIGALAGANNDADMIRIDNSPNVWIDHNELFAVNNECNGSPDGDLTFESAIDIKKSSTNVTVSYNYIRDSKKVGLSGSSASDLASNVGGRNLTFHHNIYYNVNGRLPLQRGGILHAYNNLYSKITSSGINVRTGGKAIIERNWFENSLNPVTCRFDTVNCGTWYLDSNNTTSAASNAVYGITWDTNGGAAGTLNADTWTSTLTAKPALSYTYEPVSAQCVKDKLHLVAGVGKGLRQLTAADCTGPVLTGTDELPLGFVKCADEGGVCTVASGDGWVSYGRNGNWAAKRIAVGRSIRCNAVSFGRDPGGNPNICAYRQDASGGTSIPSSSSSSAASSSAGSSSGASSSAASSSVASSSAASSAAPAAALSSWNETFMTGATATFFSTGYAAISNGGVSTPMYLVKGGNPALAANASVPGDYVLTLTGARFTAGAVSTTDSTSTSTPGGVFDIIGKTCDLVIDFAAAGSGSGKFQVTVDNNTTSSGNSIVASSRVVDIAASTIAAGSQTFTFTRAAPAANYTAGQGSFLMFRTESSTTVSINSFSLNCTTPAP